MPSLLKFTPNSVCVVTPSGTSPHDGHCGEGGRQRSYEIDGNVQGLTPGRQVEQHKVCVNTGVKGCF